MIAILILLCIALLIGIIILSQKQKKEKSDFYEREQNLQNQLSLKQNQIELFEATIKQLQEDNERLSIYRPILDTKSAIDYMLSEAESKAFRIIQDAESKNRKLLIENNGLEEVIYETKQNLKAECKSIQEVAQQEAQDRIRAAINESNRILKEARFEAEKIAGDALIAMKNASSYDQAIKAMKNIIEGYGNQYIVPSYSLLDDLAQEFSYTDAGRELLASRERTKLLVNENMAAECDYVEKNRSTTAIQFVIEAFNGKVDSILTRVKKDNYGILAQRIKDAFATVNYLGSPFRNARIRTEYLNSRLNELRWACIVVELKEQQKEEQRRIREQMREEERARREYEKAIKEAEKEEALLKKLIEKAQSQIETANEEQKLKYEKQLLELKEKLRLAEEKNQRAVSMAQQTRAGHVYIISNIGSFGENVFKIGMTRRLEPIDRITELSNASVPFSFDIHAMIYSDDAPTLELSLHRAFRDLQMNKVNSRKEFFKVDLLDIKSKLDELAIQTSWTMLAEAKQYKETLVIEEAIRRDLKSKEEWLNNQNSQEDAFLIMDREDNYLN